MGAVRKASRSLKQCRGVLAEARRAAADLPDVLWQAGSGELAEVMREVDALAMACDAGRVVVAGEAIARGEPRAATVSMSSAAWVREHAPSTRAGGAAQVIAVAEAFAVPGNAPVKEAVLEGALPVRSAAVVVAEADRLRPLLADGAEPAVLDGLIAMARSHGPRGCRMVRPRLLAKYGLDGELQREQDATRRFIALSQPIVDSSGVSEYRGSSQTRV